MTVRRIYLETMEDVIKGVNKVIIDGQSNAAANGGGNGVVPYLPLPGLDQRARQQGQPAGERGASQ